MLATCMQDDGLVLLMRTLWCAGSAVKVAPHARILGHHVSSSVLMSQQGLSTIAWKSNPFIGKNPEQPTLLYMAEKAFRRSSSSH